MRELTAGRLSIVFGGGIFGVAVAGLVAGLAGASVPLSIEGLSALAGMIAGARVA